MNRDTLRQLMPIVTLVVLVVLVAAFQPSFVNPATLLGMASDTATLFVLGMGVTFVIMLGGIDLSIQSVASLASVAVALLITPLGYLAFPVAVLVGALAGLLSGIAHVQLKIPSFIATLAVGGVAAGVALLLADAQAITLGEVERGYVGWITGTSLGIPHEVLIALVVLALGTVVQHYTAFGRYSQAIGAGEPAAHAAGIRVGLHKTIACMLSGAAAGLAGAILAGRLASGSPTLADQLLLPAIAAVIVGGTAITGGVGSMAAVAGAALFLTHLGQMLKMLGLSTAFQFIIYGIAIAIGMALAESRLGLVRRWRSR
ncbi:MAG: ABC transporter permease [Hyphomicrobiaceae bacterium]|nr:ABC transporter permease [Hyphomicrobiaceae bacterium]